MSSLIIRSAAAKQNKRWEGMRTLKSHCELSMQLEKCERFPGGHGSVGHSVVGFILNPQVGDLGSRETSHWACYSSL